MLSSATIFGLLISLNSYKENYELIDAPFFPQVRSDKPKS